MRKLLFVLAMICIPVLAHAGVSSYVNTSRFSQLYIAPISYAFQNDTKADPRFGAGISYGVGQVLGLNTAFKFDYTQPYNRDHAQYGSAALVFYFN